MRLHLVSAASEPGGAAPNEDRWGVTDTGYAWVIDGATSTGPARIAREGTDGAWFAGRLDSVLRRLAETGNGTDPYEMLQLAAAEIRQELVHDGVDPDDRPPYASIALVAIAEAQLRYAVLGDVLLAILRPEDKAVTILRDERSDPFVDKAIDLSYRYTGEDLRAQQRAFEAHNVNTAEGYPILTTSAESAAAAHHGAVQMDRGAVVLLASDGLTYRNDLGNEAAVLDLILRVRDDGVALELAAVRKLEHDDPGRARCRRIKQHDDSTGVLLTVS